MQQDTSVKRVGGIGAIGVGVLYVGFAALLAITPQTDNSVFDHAHHSGLFVATHYLLAFAGLFGLAAVGGLGTMIHGEQGWVRWGSVMAYVGFALLAINNFRQADLDLRLAEAWLTADPALQAVIVTTWAGLTELSPTGTELGMIGLWMLILSWLARRQQAMPPLLAYIGIGGGILVLLIVVGVMLQQRALAMVAMLAGGVVLLPTWLIWNGIRLLRS